MNYEKWLTPYFKTNNNNNNNNTNNMTNLETKIEGLKNKKAGLSFTTDMETILSKKYAEIWDDIDSTYVQDMIREELNEKDNLTLVFNDENKVVTVEKYNISYVNNKVVKSEHVKGKYIVNISTMNKGWETLDDYELSDLLVVTDFDAYLDYRLERVENNNKIQIERLQKEIEDLNKDFEKTVTYYTDAKRFGLKDVNRRIINRLRKAELIKDNKASLEEIADILF